MAGQTYERIVADLSSLIDYLARSSYNNKCYTGKAFIVGLFLGLATWLSGRKQVKLSRVSSGKEEEYASEISYPK